MPVRMAPMDLQELLETRALWEESDRRETEVSKETQARMGLLEVRLAQQALTAQEVLLAMVGPKAFLDRQVRPGLLVMMPPLVPTAKLAKWVSRESKAPKASMGLSAIWALRATLERKAKTVPQATMATSARLA